MKALKFDINVPFWCSFADFGSLNIKLSYPVPPLTTLFGLIQNAFGKPSLHTINSNSYRKKLEREYLINFDNLKFSIIIRNEGELIEDYTNILKGSRQDTVIKKYQTILKNKLKKYKEIKPYSNNLVKYDFFLYIKNNFVEENIVYDEILNFIKINNNEFIIDIIKEFWIKYTQHLNGYDLKRYWMNTQINRQKIVNPYYTIYVISDDNNEFSLENIYKFLKTPYRPLYIGESDDVVDILNLELVKINKNNSSNISSILPGIYENSNLIKLPVNLKFNKNKSNNQIVCSIPNGDIDKSIECYSYNGENFVFL